MEVKRHFFISCWGCEGFGSIWFCFGVRHLSKDYKNNMSDSVWKLRNTMIILDFLAILFCAGFTSVSVLNILFGIPAFIRLALVVFPCVWPLIACFVISYFYTWALLAPMVLLNAGETLETTFFSILFIIHWIITFPFFLFVSVLKKEDDKIKRLLSMLSEQKYAENAENRVLETIERQLEAINTLPADSRNVFSVENGKHQPLPPQISIHFHVHSGESQPMKQPDRVEETKESERQCSICLENAAQFAVVPCGHICLC